MTNAYATTIRAFIAKNFFVGQDGAALGADQSFLDSGVVDSTGMLELVTFIEDEYGIKLSDDELVPENLDSIDRICAFIARKAAVSGPCEEIASNT